MTSPEKSRRRQRIEGSLILVLGVFTVAYTIHDTQQEDEDRLCVQDTVSDIVAVIENSREANRVTTDALHQVIFDGLSGKFETRRDVTRARRVYVKARAEATRLRAEAPLPPDPEKVCQ